MRLARRPQNTNCLIFEQFVLIAASAAGVRHENRKSLVGETSDFRRAESLRISFAGSCHSARVMIQPLLNATLAEQQLVGREIALSF
jgi:hypothetical protein